MRPSLGQSVEHVVGGVAVGERRLVARVGQDVGFGGMHAAIREFVVAADMIEMGVAGDADYLLFGDQRHMPAQADMAEPGVEQQVAVASPDVPDVAAEEGLIQGS